MPTCASSTSRTAPRIALPDPDWDEPGETLDYRRVTLSRLAPGEQFVYVFDLGDDWAHLCTVGPQRLDPEQALGITPSGSAALLGRRRGTEAPYLLVMGWPEQTSTPELLTQYAATLVELRRRGVLRTNNAPLGDYAEWLLHRALGGALADSTSAKSFDLMLEDGRRVQIEARLVSEPPARGQLQTSPFRSWDFEIAALMLFRGDSYAPVLAVLAPRRNLADPRSPSTACQRRCRVHPPALDHRTWR